MKSTDKVVTTVRLLYWMCCFAEYNQKCFEESIVHNCFESCKNHMFSLGVS